MDDDALTPRLHYRPPDGWLGDVHPLFRGGKWHVYHLQVPLEPLRAGLSRVHSVDLVGSDLIRWKKAAIQNEDPSRAWWAIANLEVGGKIYSFYNGDRGFDLSTSEDGRAWQTHAANPVVPYPKDGLLECRDPYVFRHEPSGRYYMVVAGKKRGDLHYTRAGLYLYATSDDLTRWSELKTLHDPGDIGIPECPDLFEMGGRYYLVGSWGVDRVGQGRYRVADHPEGPWRTPEVDTLDGTEIMAPNTGWDGKRRLFFGWVPTYQGRKDAAPYEWGGHLTWPREVYTGANGELFLRLPDEFLALRGRVSRPKPGACEILSGKWEAGPDALTLPAGGGRGEFLLPGEHRRFEAEAILTLSPNCPEAGLTFRAGGADFPGYAVSVDLRGQRLLLRRRGGDNPVLASARIKITPGEPLRLRVFVDGDIVEAFLSDRYSVAGRAQADPGAHRVGFFAEGGSCRVERPAVYALKAVYPARQPASLDTRPAPDPARAGGGSVLFPVPGANVYTPFRPALNFSGSFTLECRIKMTPGTEGFKSNLIAKGDGATGYHYGLNLAHGSALELYYRTPTGYMGAVSARGAVPGGGRWAHVAGVVDLERKEIRLYRDGRRIAAKPIPGEALDPTDRGALRLGNANGLPNADPFYGLMDEVRLWDGARTDAQIRAAFDGPVRADDSAGLAVRWNFDAPRPGAVGGRLESPNLAPANADSADLTGTLFDGAVPQPENGLPPKGSGRTNP